jgi:hypothetical protein
VIEGKLLSHGTVPRQCPLGHVEKAQDVEATFRERQPARGVYLAKRLVRYDPTRQ